MKHIYSALLYLVLADSGLVYSCSLFYDPRMDSSARHIEIIKAYGQFPEGLIFEEIYNSLSYGGELPITIYKGNWPNVKKIAFFNKDKLCTYDETNAEKCVDKDINGVNLNHYFEFGDSVSLGYYVGNKRVSETIYIKMNDSSYAEIKLKSRKVRNTKERKFKLDVLWGQFIDWCSA